MHISSVSTGHPPHHYNQEQLLNAIQRMWATKHHNPRRVEQLHKAVQVKERFLALPMEAYEQINDFQNPTITSFKWVQMSPKKLRDALDQSGLTPTDVDAIFFVSVTGVATPSIDAKLVNRLGLRPDVKRIPIFGLGCVAGAAGLARVHDYLKGYPEHVAVLVSVELCSLTLQPKDLCGQPHCQWTLWRWWWACVVGIGDNHPAAKQGQAQVIAVKAVYPDTEDVMGGKSCRWFQSHSQSDCTCVGRGAFTTRCRSVSSQA